MELRVGIGAPAWKEPDEAVRLTATALMAAAFDELFREGAMLDNAAVTVQSEGLSLSDLRKACRW
jgi:hypothetical protein